MAFIEKMARVDDEHLECCDEGEVRHDSDLDFIDDETSFQDQEPSDYRLKNVTKSLQEALEDTSMKLYFACPYPENYVPYFADDIKYNYDDFRSLRKHLEFTKRTVRIRSLMLFCLVRILNLKLITGKNLFRARKNYKVLSEKFL